MDLIQDKGLQSALNERNEIANYASNKASICLEKYTEDRKAMEFLAFIAKFEFISTDFIEYVQDKSKEDVFAYLQQFILDAVCERIDPIGNYYRVNEILRDFIQRGNNPIPQKFSLVLDSFVDDFLENYDSGNYDVSEYQIALVEALKSGKETPAKLLIPSHFLKTIKDLYAGRSRLRDVVKLAKRVLQKSDYYDEHIVQDIRYFLCQALARLKDEDFKREVQKIRGPEHNFLFGFYHRMNGNYQKAYEYFLKSLEARRTEQRSRRELVLVLTRMEAFEKALTLAADNYTKYPENPHIIQSYFLCIYYANSNDNTQQQLDELLEAISRISSETAYEMKASMNALYHYKFGKKLDAFELIDDAIVQHNKVPYPVLTKLDMAMSSNNKTKIQDALRALEAFSSTQARSGMKVEKAELLLLALEGKAHRAISLVEVKLKNLATPARQKFTKILEEAGKSPTRAEHA